MFYVKTNAFWKIPSSNTFWKKHVCTHFSYIVTFISFLTNSLPDLYVNSEIGYHFAVQSVSIDDFDLRIQIMTIIIIDLQCTTNGNWSSYPLIAIRDPVSPWTRVGFRVGGTKPTHVIIYFWHTVLSPYKYLCLCLCHWLQYCGIYISHLLRFAIFRNRVFDFH